MVDIQKQVILQQLLTTQRSWWGVTEPTLCTRATKRLYEKTKTTADEEAIHTSSELVFHYADYVRNQHVLGAGGDMVHLPRIVQYDLFHITEALPEDRSIALTDEVHSFFLKQEAMEQLFDHLLTYHKEGSIPCLLWHTFHPAYGLGKDFYSFDGVGPFAALSNKEQQYAILQCLSACVHLPEEDWPTDIRPEQQQALRTFQHKLDAIARFANQLADAGIIALFRLFHEANGHWFWWSEKSFAPSKQEGRFFLGQLWKNTRYYIEIVKGVKNLLWTWSPNIMPQWYESEEVLIHQYTCGVDMADIDVLGIDVYGHSLIRNIEPIQHLRRQTIERALEIIASLRRHFSDKPVGFTELGGSYHKLLPGDDTEASIGDESRGGALFTEELLQQFGAQNEYHPHFTIFWRNEPQLLESPVVGVSEAMDKDALRLVEYMDTLYRQQHNDEAPYS